MSRPRLSAAAVLAAVFSAGLLAGRTTQPVAALAQDDAEAAEMPEMSEAAMNEVRASARALESARDELEAGDRYQMAAEGLNPFLILSGGGNAVADLESDEGVDPETFAALYAGRASSEIKDSLSTDDDGRLLYKGKAVRMYSIEKLKKAYAERDRLTAVDSGF